jgi:hypothetical protein
MTPFERSVARTRTILDRHLAHGAPERAWEVELARLFGVDLPAASIAGIVGLWNASVEATPFPDGIGPWGRHPVWDEESYGIGHTRTFVRILVDAGAEVARRDEVAAWIRGMQGADGGFACHAEFTRLYRERHPERAARRDRDARAGAKRATGAAAPGAWAHSDLEDAWSAIDALAALGTAPRDRHGAVAWLQRQQRADGAFASPPTYDAGGERYGGALSDTMHAVRALARLGAKPADRALCVAWLLGGPEPPLIVPQWAMIESLAVLDALELWIDAPALDRWAQLEFSTDDTETRVSFEAYAAIRGNQLLAA